MNERPRIKDLAQRLGVSPATVSRAFSRAPGSSPSRRCRASAMPRAKLNYRPNVSARNLRTQRSMSVLMVVRDIGNPFYLEVMKGVEQAARKAGYSVLMGNTENDPDRESEYFDMLRDGHADGMILMTGQAAGEWGDPLGTAGGRGAGDDRGAAACLTSRSTISPPHAGRSTTDRARPPAHCHITGPLPEVMSTLRRDGWRAALADANLAVADEYERRGDYQLHTGQVLCAVLLDLPEPPTAIFCAMMNRPLARSTNCTVAVATCRATSPSWASTTSI